MKVAPGVSLETIIARTDRLAERFDDLRQRHNLGTERELTPDPETLYPSRLRAAMPGAVGVVWFLPRRPAHRRRQGCP